MYNFNYLQSYMDNKEKKNNIFIWSIIILVIVIAILWYYFWNKSSNNIAIDSNSITTDSNSIVSSTGNYEDLTLTVIGDTRCWAKCPTNAILEQLKQLPSISNAKIVVKDFSDEWVSEYLKSNEIKTLPLFQFSTNNFDTSKDPDQKDQNGNLVPKVNTFLTELKDGSYSLSVGSTFNPFEKRSDRGFLQIAPDKIKTIKDSSYIKWNKDAKITWLEYSDLECPFCAKLHNSDVEKVLTEKYGYDLNIVFNHFPLGFHKNAQTGAEILECLGEQKWGDAFYSLLKKSYTDKNSDKDFLISEAVKLWADKDKLNKCLTDGTYTQKVKDMQNAGAELFKITGTPWNVLINNETGEYEVISWAYPAESFVEIIDKLK